MREVTVATRAGGPCTVDEAWERYADPARWPTWAPHLRSVELDEPGTRLRAGLSGTVRGVWPVSARFVVTAVDASARRWSWTVRTSRPRLAVELHHTLEVGDRGTEAGLVLRGPWAVVLGYRPVARCALRRLLG